MLTANVMNSRPSFVMAIGAILLASLAAVAQDNDVHCETVRWKIPEAQPVVVKVVDGGEWPRTADECRGVVVGPGVNEPDPFPGYGGFVGWESPVRLHDGTWRVGFNAGYWHASPPTLDLTRHSASE